LDEAKETSVYELHMNTRMKPHHLQVEEEDVYVNFENHSIKAVSARCKKNLGGRTKYPITTLAAWNPVQP
jgi:hypothetical protein